jgi:cell wall-associated NlpC family hydrolase
MIDRTPSAASRDRPAPPRSDVTGTLRVISPVAPLVAEPRAAATLTSQYLAGHHVDLLEVRGDWARVRGADAYEGWMHAGYLGHPVARRAADERISLGCIVRGTNGHRRALPLGALLDDGETLLDGEIVAGSEVASHFPAEGTAVAGSAIRFFEGTSYLWGGVTPWGADCSGLVQSICALHGIPMPRDASDQGRCGVDIPATPDTLAAGDLLFFTDREDGQITHVGIAMGQARLVHLALGRGGYAVEPLRGETDSYGMALRTRIRFARRVLGAAAR